MAKQPELWFNQQQRGWQSGSGDSLWQWEFCPMDGGRISSSFWMARYPHNCGRSMAPWPHGPMAPWLCLIPWSLHMFTPLFVWRMFDLSYWFGMMIQSQLSFSGGLKAQSSNVSVLKSTCFTACIPNFLWWWTMRWTVGVLWIGLVAIKNPMPLELIRQKYMMKTCRNWR